MTILFKKKGVSYVQSPQIRIVHIILLSMTVIGLKNHVTIIPSLLAVGGRDSWMSVIVASIFTIPWLLLILYIFRNLQKQSMRDWLLQSFGKVGGNVLIGLIGIYCLLLSAVTMRETLEWIRATFLASTPIAILLVIYVILITLLISTNVETIAIVNVVVLFVVVILGLFVAIINIQVKDYELIKPMLEHGMAPVWKAAVYPASGFVELFPFLFILHNVKGELAAKHLMLMLFLLTGLTLGPLLGAITEFGPAEAARQLYPAYEEWGLATVGRYIEHMDFFSIYQWLTGTFIRVGVIMYIGIQLFGIAGNERAIWRYVTPALFFSSTGLFFMRDEYFLTLKGHYLIYTTFIFFFAIFAWKIWRQKKGGDIVERQ